MAHVTSSVKPFGLRPRTHLKLGHFSKCLKPIDICSVNCIPYYLTIYMTDAQLKSTHKIKKLYPEDIKSIWDKQNVILDRESTAETACWTIPNKKPNPKGYIQISNPVNTQDKYYLHHVAYAAEYGTDTLPVDRSRHLSHLCNNPRCCRPDHLHVESVATNLSRNYCIRFMKCPSCDHSFFVCVHNPPCLGDNPRRTRDLE